jgi:membrane protease YdiL (CAAX protease family)
VTSDGQNSPCEPDPGLIPGVPQTDPIPPVNPPQENANRPLFSARATVLWTIAFLAGAGFVLYSLGNGRDQLLEEPEYFVERVVGRDLDASECAPDLSLWERIVNVWNISSPAEARDEAIDTCRRFENDGVLTNSPMLHQLLAVLLAETGQTNEAIKELAPISGEPSGSRFTQVFQAAYLTNLPAFHLADPERVLSAVSPEWVHDQVALKLAQRTGDTAQVIQIRSELKARGRVLQDRVTIMSALDLGLVISGLCLIAAWFRQGGSVSVGDFGYPLSPWDVPTGYAVLIRGGVIALALAGGLTVLSDRCWPLTGITTIVSALPLLWLVNRYLLGPFGFSFVSKFGLSAPKGDWGRLLGLSLVVMSLMVMGEGTLSVILSQWQQSPLSESIPEDLLFNPWPHVLCSSIDTVIWAPIVEEIIFRGIVYGTLRRRLSPLAAATVSSALFGVVHGYSLVGFLIICWSGFLWSLAYERSRSLLPGMLCHALSNALATISPILVYRL